MSSELDPRAVQLLLRCVQSPNDCFPATVTLEAFRNRYQDIGRQKRKNIYLSDQDKEKIRSILRSEGIDPTTPADAWRGLTRTEALVLGNNEKLTNDPVKRRRVAIKALRPDMPLIINGEVMRLPAHCHLDIDYEAVDVTGHDWIVVVENWEAFNDIHRVIESVVFPGTAPLCVWRGDASMTRADAMLGLINGLTQPVAAFVDYDPEGMVIARSLPRLQRVVAPPLDVLKEMLQAGVRDRYLAQIPQCQNTLDQMTDDLVRPIWEIIRQAGKALPQEKLVGVVHRCEAGILAASYEWQQS